MESVGVLGELGTEEYPYISPTQGGARGGSGRPQVEGVSEKLGVQRSITDNVRIINAGSPIKDAQITNKNRSTYKDRLLGIMDLKEVNRIMDLYDETIKLKQQLRILRKE